MEKGPPIDSRNHIARYISMKKHTEDGRPSALAFLLENDDALSVDWLEFFNRIGLQENIAALQDQYQQRAISKTFTARRSGHLAVAEIEQLLDHVRREEQKDPTRKFGTLSVHQDGDPPADNPSHAGMFGIHPESLAITSAHLASVRP